MNRLYVAEGAYTNTGAAGRFIACRSGRGHVAALAARHRQGGRASRGLPRIVRIDRDWQAKGNGPPPSARTSRRTRAVGWSWSASRSRPSPTRSATRSTGPSANVGPDAAVTLHRPDRGRPGRPRLVLRRTGQGHRGWQGRDLIILGGNPAYDRAGRPRVRQGPSGTRPEEEGLDGIQARRASHDDETARALCGRDLRGHWHVPEAHFLESWGDARAFDGTATIVQPLISPALPTASRRSRWSAAMIGHFDRSPLKVWSRNTGGARRGTRRLRGLSGGRPCTTGKVEGSASAPKSSRRSKPMASALRRWIRPRRSRPRGLELRSSSAPTRRSGTAGSPTTGGSRNCPSRSPS